MIEAVYRRFGLKEEAKKESKKENRAARFSFCLFRRVSCSAGFPLE